MLKDFDKMATFLMVVKEKSFSKASAKLGISQPAVTQQIKYMEEYLDTKIIERKKNGIKLTKEGETLFYISKKLEKAVNNANKDLVKITKKELTFIIGASFTIGDYILPTYLDNIKKHIKNDVAIKVDVSKNIINELLERRIDIALIESPISENGLMYRDWSEDELVVVSNKPIAKYLKKDDLYKFDWVCREEGSFTRKLVSEMFDSMDINCQSFNVKSEVTSSTAVKQTLLRTDKSGKATVSIISKYVIADEVKNGTLFESKITGSKLKRKLYLAYLKDKKNDVYLNNIVNYLMG